MASSFSSSQVRIDRMKVGKAMGLGFTLVIAMGLILAIVAWMQLNRTSEAVELLVEDRAMKLLVTSQIEHYQGEQERGVRGILLNRENAGKEIEKKRLYEARAQIDGLVGTLQRTANTERGKALVQKITDSRNRFNERLNKVVDLAMAHQEEQGLGILISEVPPLEAEYFKSLKEYTQLLETLMNETAQSTNTQAHSAEWLMLVLAVVMALMGGGIAVFLTRFILGRLGGEPDYAAEIVQEISAGNLAVEIRTAQGDTTSLLAHMHDMRDSLARVVAQVRQGSESVATASAQIAQSNQDLSGRTESQASALEQTAASMEQLGTTVKQNADNARQADQLARSATAVAEQGGTLVGQVVTTMEGITQSSRKIADIIQVIDGIAFQTNILALNAAVEAARAGEQGRGFAVVAGEVRSLAGRSADAAKQIKQLIDDSVQRVEQGASLVGMAGQTMQEIVTSIQHVTDIVGQISIASSEQSQGVIQVGEAVGQMDHTTQQNATLVEKMASATQSLNQQAQELVRAVAVFQIQDSGATHHRYALPAPSQSN